MGMIPRQELVKKTELLWKFGLFPPKSCSQTLLLLWEEEEVGEAQPSQSGMGMAALGEGFGSHFQPQHQSVGWDDGSSWNDGYVLPMEAPGSAPRDERIHPKKPQDSGIHLLRLHENEAQILSGKNKPGMESTNPTLPIIQLFHPQGSGADSIGIPKFRDKFWDSAPESTLKPHRAEPREQGGNNMDAMRIHGNKTQPPRCRVRG